MLCTVLWIFSGELKISTAAAGFRDQLASDSSVGVAGSGLETASAQLMKLTNSRADIDELSVG